MDMDEYNLMHNVDREIHHNLENVLYMNNIVVNKVINVDLNKFFY